MTSIVTGDDIDLSVTLQDAAGAAVNVSTATEIKVALRTPSTSVAGPYTASSGYTGASWSTGVVIVRVPSADSGAIPTTATTVQVEVQVVIASVKTTYIGTAQIVVVRGTIA